MLGLNDNSLRAQLRKLHSMGVWNVTEEQVPTLVAFPAIAQQIPRYSHEALRVALQDVLQRAAARMSPKDQEIVLVLYGLSPYESVGPKNRHKLLPGIVGQPWSQYRSSPFENLSTRLIQALNAVNDSAPLLSGAVGRGYRLLSLKQQYLEPTEDQPVLSIVENRKVKVEAPELTTWAQNYRLQLVSATAPPSIRHVGDGRFSVETIEVADQEGVGFELELRIDFIRPLRYGDVFEFTLIKDTPVDLETYRKSPGTFHSGFTAGLEIDELEITVVFDPGHPPSQLRKVNGTSPAKSFQADLAEAEQLPIDLHRPVTASWKHLAWQRWYGLVWN